MAQTKNSTKKSTYKHLSFEERQLIQLWHDIPLSNREIGRRLNRSHQTIANELKRGITSQIKGNKKRVQVYYADTGQARYAKKRKNCGAKSKMISAPAALFEEEVQKIKVKTCW